MARGAATSYSGCCSAGYVQGTVRVVGKEGSSSGCSPRIPWSSREEAGTVASLGPDHVEASCRKVVRSTLRSEALASHHP